MHDHKTAEYIYKFMDDTAQTLNKEEIFPMVVLAYREEGEGKVEPIIYLACDYSNEQILGILEQFKVLLTKPTTPHALRRIT